ncbi:hypothetical protein [Halarchaeum nitratireducens]|nr:hypothetical protein [Halarchaeum nitratireducens]
MDMMGTGVTAREYRRNGIAVRVVADEPTGFAGGWRAQLVVKVIR